MKKVTVIAALVFFCALIPIYGQNPVVIKLASMVPKNTDWGRAIDKLAVEWSRVTNGEVKLIVYADGTQGSEDQILQKLRTNHIQAGIFTSFGLTKMAPEILTMSCPFLIQNDAELDEVLRNVKGEFEAKINANQFYQSLALVKAGWVKFFSKDPVFVPADLKKQKVGSAPSEPEMAQVFRAMGYQVVMVDNNRVLISLRQGSINAIYMSPIFAAGSQYFGVAKNMASINVAPVVAGIVVNKETWKKIPAHHQTSIINVTRRIGAELETSLLKLENDMIRQMKNNGLQENQLNAQQRQEWYTETAKAIPGLLGSTFDRATYTRIEGILRTYRSRQ